MTVARSARAMVTMGCPSGIGPEVGVVAASEPRSARALLVGDYGAALAAAAGRGIDPRRLSRVDEPREAWTLPRARVAVWQPTRDLAAADRRLGRPTPASGAAQLAWVNAACD